MTIDTTSFSEELLEQASAWVVRLRSDRATEQDQQDFALWLAESPKHQAAFDETMVLWEAMGTCVDSSAGESSITALLGRVSSNNGPQASNDDTDRPITGFSAVAQPVTNAPIPWLASLAAMAASVIMVGLVFFASNPAVHKPANPAQTLYATPVGKQQRFTLPDGSVVELNTDSQVAITYTQDRRNLTLLKGEAFFDVEPNPSRPFVVAAGVGEVTAVGTAFIIRLSANDMAVAVTEGHVKVADNGHTDRSVPVAVGQQTLVTEANSIGAVEAADLALVSAWREKTLIFRATDLAAALEELNRYLSQPVDTSDPSLKNLNVSGTFSLEEPEVTLKAIVDAFELQSYRNPFDDKRRLYLR